MNLFVKALRQVRNDRTWTKDEIDEFNRCFIFISKKLLPEAITQLSAIVLVGSVLNPILVSIVISTLFFFYIRDRWMEALAGENMAFFFQPPTIRKFLDNEHNRFAIYARGTLYTFLITFLFLGISTLVSLNITLQKR